MHDDHDTQQHSPAVPCQRTAKMRLERRMGPPTEGSALGGELIGGDDLTGPEGLACDRAVGRMRGGDLSERRA